MGSNPMVSNGIPTVDTQPSQFWEDDKQCSRIQLSTDNNASMYDESGAGEAPSDNAYHAPPRRIARGVAKDQKCGTLRR